jgi:hypothetical protein
MTNYRAPHAHRRLYARLLRLYPETFRNRFAESMEQTFHDLCRERQAAGGGLFAFALGLFAETFAGILRERIALIMPPRRNIIRLTLITASILSVPLVGMQFSNEVEWSLFDFVAAGGLLFGTGLTLELVARKSANIAYRVATGLACAAALLLIWINLAVGLIGSEDNPTNLLYLGVLMVGGFGAATARLRPQGMARALFATAVVQAVVPLLAILIWKPLVADEKNLGGLIGVTFLNAFLVLLFLASAVSFRRAGDTKPKPS